MIIDCHSHIWPARKILGQAQDFSCIAPPQIDFASADLHFQSSSPAHMVFVLGFASNHINAEISNEFISNYVAEHPDRMIGFAGIDPTGKNCLEDIRRHHDNPSFVGLTLCPAVQAVHPCDSRFLKIYELAEELEMPLYFLQGESLPSQAFLEYANPVLLDEVARNFPSLVMVVSHLGYPWVEQTIALMAKHPNVYSDIAGLPNKPWQAYRMLTLAYEYDVIRKLFFASDFPAQTVKSAVEAIYNLNKITMDSILPAVPREQLRSIIERDSLTIFKLPQPQNR